MFDRIFITLIHKYTNAAEDKDTKSLFANTSGLQKELRRKPFSSEEVNDIQVSLLSGEVGAKCPK